MRCQLFLLCSDLQIVLLPEGVPPPVGLQSGEAELHLALGYLQIFHERDDGLVAELSLVLPAVGDHLVLGLRLQADFAQYRHPVAVSLPQQIIEENLRRNSNIRGCIIIMNISQLTFGVRL